MLSGMIYSIRKRIDFRIGDTVFWLKYHRWSSLVGLILVLIHTEGRVYGLAGLSIFLLLVITVSGFIGLYIFTRIPRDRFGKVRKLKELKNELFAIVKDLDQLDLDRRSPEDRKDFTGTITKEGSGEVGGGNFQPIISIAVENFSNRMRASFIHDRVTKLDQKRKRIQQQIDRLDTMRSLLAGWRSWHNLLSALFLLTVVIHVISIFYYGDYVRWLK